MIRSCRLTTHSTGLAIGQPFIINVNCSPVNSGVKSCAAGDSLNLLTLSIAARAIEWLGELKGLTLRVLSMLNGDARPTACAVRSRRSGGASSNKSLKPLIEWLFGRMMLASLKADRTRLNSSVGRLRDMKDVKYEKGLVAHYHLLRNS